MKRVLGFIFALCCVGLAHGSAYPPLTLSAAGISPPQPINFATSGSVAPNYTIGLVASLSPNASGANYTVEVTGDQQPTTNGNWVNHDVLVNQTASALGNIGYPVTGVRLRLNAISTGSVTLAITKYP